MAWTIRIVFFQILSDIDLPLRNKVLKNEWPCVSSQDRMEPVELKLFLAYKGQEVPEIWHRVRFCCWHSTYNTFSPSNSAIHVCLAE